MIKKTISANGAIPTPEEIPLGAHEPRDAADQVFREPDAFAACAGLRHSRCLISRLLVRALVVCPLLVVFASTALARFTQQGAKLVGTGATGPANQGSYQGQSVAVSADGNTAVVGGWYDNNGVGAAWVYTRSGGAWTQQGAKLVGTGATGLAYQGYSVAISADGNTAVVGGFYDNTGAGAVWVFTRSGGVWMQQGNKLVGTGATEGGAGQGYSVALSPDGSTVAIGGLYDNYLAGAVWMFTRSGTVWTQQGGKLVGTGATGGTGLDAYQGSQQGSSVALSSDGSTLVVGGKNDNAQGGGPDGVGAAWVWTRSGGVWTQQGNKLVGTGATRPASQGSSAALSWDGNTAVVGGGGDFGGAGVAWVWTRSGGVWTQQGNKLLGTGFTGPGGSGYPGNSVAISSDGSMAVVGGPGDNFGAGGVWVYTLSGGLWSQHGAELVGTGTTGIAFQGTSVALSSDASTLVVGGDYDNGAAGAAWVFAAPPGSPTVTLTTTSVAANATSLTITGTNFDFVTPGNNTVAFSPTGTGTVTVATATSLTVSSVTGLTAGTLSAVVTNTIDNSGAAVQVAAVTLVTLSVAGGDPLSQPTAGISLGSTPTGTTFDRSFTLTNSSSITLTGLRLGITGTNAGQVAVLQDLPGTLAPGASATFTVHLTPLIAGEFSALVSVLSDQTTATPVAIQFSALVQAAQISVISAAGDAFAQGAPEVFKYWDAYGYSLTSSAGAQGAVAVAQGSYQIVSLMRDGTVYATDPGPGLPQGLAGVTAIAAGNGYSMALKGDGTVVAWGNSIFGAVSIPAGLKGVTAIATGHEHALALRNDGTIVAWGDNNFGQAKVPAGLRGVIAMAAGPNRSVALKSDGTVVNWGAPVTDGNNSAKTPTPAPGSLRNVTALAAGEGHTVALKGDGTVVAWGQNSQGQTLVPAGLTGVVAVAAGSLHTLALKSDGTVVSWGLNTDTHGLPASLTGVTSISVFDDTNLALANGGAFAGVPVGKTRDFALSIGNTGTAYLSGVQVLIDGPDASQFSISSPPKSGPYAYDPGGQDLSTCSVRFAPTTGGPKTATLKIYSNDPTVSPFIVPLTGYGSQVAVKAGVAGASFTYGMPTSDPLTGLLLQKISYTNTTTLALNGLRLVLANVTPGTIVYSSSAGDKPGTLDVLYTNPIAAGETVKFTLAYFDPQRRSAATNPIINAEELKTPEPQPGPVDGTLIKLLSIRDTPEGPLLEWSTVSGGTYVVEYSDDHGATWHSAVHRLGNGGSRMLWADRGQPETQTTPLNKAARMYRVKKV